MGIEPKSVTTLRAYYSDRTAVMTNEEMTAELLGGNDRATIISIGALSDSAVEYLLATNLPALRNAEQKAFDQAFRHDGPLGTFSSRIDMAFYMGLIDEKFRGQLHDLRQLRNAVAHTKRHVSLEDAPLQNVAKRILHPIGYFKLLDESAKGIRSALIAEANLIYNRLVYGNDAAVEMVRDAFDRAGKASPV
jgi:hypothetical protein